MIARYYLNVFVVVLVSSDGDLETHHQKTLADFLSIKRIIVLQDAMFADVVDVCKFQDVSR